MVDATGLRKKFRALPSVIEETLTKQFEKEADKLVKEMRLFLAITWPEVEPDIEIEWTWGDAPAGSVQIGTVRGREIASIGVTIYARAKSGSGVAAHWFEFGTGERVQTKTGRRTGRITAGPFFFPPYRANRQRIRNNLRSALRRSVRKLSA